MPELDQSWFNLVPRPSPRFGELPRDPAIPGKLFELFVAHFEKNECANEAEGFGDDKQHRPADHGAFGHHPESKN